MLKPVQIQRGPKIYNVGALAAHVRKQGLVVFETSKYHQHILAKEVCERLEREGFCIAYAETPGRGGVMCVVDIDRNSMHVVLTAVQEERAEEERVDPQGKVQSQS